MHHAGGVAFVMASWACGVAARGDARRRHGYDETRSKRAVCRGRGVAVWAQAVREKNEASAQPIVLRRRLGPDLIYRRLNSGLFLFFFPF